MPPEKGRYRPAPPVPGMEFNAPRCSGGLPGDRQVAAQQRALLRRVQVGAQFVPAHHPRSGALDAQGKVGSGLAMVMGKLRKVNRGRSQRLGKPLALGRGQSLEVIAKLHGKNISVLK